MGATTIPRGTKSKPKAPPATNGASWTPELHEIPIASIDIGSNVRRDIDGLDELAASIRSVGILQPIRVEESGAGRYALVYGQRRLAAAREAGLSTIPALVDTNNRTGTALIVSQLIENLQREDLNPLEEAAAMRTLLDADGKLTQAGLAKQLGRAPSTVSNALRMLKLPPTVQERIADGSVSASHAKAIASLPPKEAEQVAERITKDALSSHAVEAALAAAHERASFEDRRRDAQRNRDKELLAGWLALLLKKKADPETTTLVGWAGIPSDGLAALAKQGWKRSQTAARGVDQAWRAPAPKGFCDCEAYELTYRIAWRSSGEVYHPQVHPACIVKEHQAAADKAERKAFDAQQAEQRATETKAREEREAALAPLAAEVATPIPPTKAKLILFTMLGTGENDYYGARHWTAARGVEHFPYSEWREHLWTAIDALSHERLLIEIAQLVAVAAVDAGGKVRIAIDGLVEPKATKATKAASS